MIPASAEADSNTKSVAGRRQFDSPPAGDVRINATKRAALKLDERMLRYARLRRGKQEVDLLLRDFDHREAKLPGDQRLDIKRLRVALGLDR